MQYSLCCIHIPTKHHTLIRNLLINMMPAINPIPVVHVEESTKRYYNVKSKHGNIHRKKYYDVDWRFYIMHKYGSYVVCGTRCPMREYYNEAWPVVSASFATDHDVVKYITLLIGSNKVNMTMFVSRLAGNDNDAAFTQPTNNRFRELDAERCDRRGEIVGYDRLSLSSSYELKLEKMLAIMSTLNNGGIVPFTVSPHPLNNRLQQTQQTQNQFSSAPVCSLPTFYQYATKVADARADADMPPLESARTNDVDNDDDCYGYVLGDHDAYAEVD